MDAEEYDIPPRAEADEVLDYANVEDFKLPASAEFKKPESPALTPSNLPVLLSGVGDYVPTTPAASSSTAGLSAEPSSSASTSMAMKDNSAMTPTPSVNPALLLTRYDKRKSSPAVLGLPLGLSEEEQLNLHLSQPRNSIEAAMLLATFNRIPSADKAEGSGKGSLNSAQWQDDMSIAAESQSKHAWLSGGQLTAESEAMRRHSYDVNMSWKTMPQSFLERLPTVPDVSSTASVEEQSTATAGEKLSWTQDGMFLGDAPITATGEYAHMFEFMQHPTSPQRQTTPTATTQEHLLYGQGSSTYNNSDNNPNEPSSSSAQETGIKRDRAAAFEEYYNTYGYPSQPILSPYHYQFQPNKLPLPTSDTQIFPSPQMQPSSEPAASSSQATRVPRRKKNRTEQEEEEVVEPGDPDFPDMSPKDVEAARTNPEARPRRQKMRFLDDKYTPKWVRYNGQAKEGLCDTCKPGKWLQLKNSAFWYHKQFYHGISSVSGKEFVPPLETRRVDQNVLEGLCHQCRQWVAVNNMKRKNSVLWYRHAHKCHVYHKPKSETIRKR